MREEHRTKSLEKKMLTSAETQKTRERKKLLNPEDKVKELRVNWIEATTTTKEPGENRDNVEK